MQTLIYTAEIDNRYGVGKVSSRIGLTTEAAIFNNYSDIFKQVEKVLVEQQIHCLLIDEAQFLTQEQVKQLTHITDQLDIPVLCYGLRTDFRGELFAGSQYLLAWADKLVELKTVCHCGRKANMVLRLDAAGKPYYQGAQVDIGGNEKYISVCRKHYWQAIEQHDTTAIYGDNPLQKID